MNFLPEQPISINPGSSQAKGLIGFWPLNDRAEPLGTARDISGNGNHGTLLDNADFQSSKRGRSAYFGGTGGDPDHIDIGALNLSDLSAFTITSWAYLISKPSDRDIVSQPQVGGTTELRYDLGDDLWEFNVYDGSFKYAKFDQKTPEINKWVHICGVYDGSTIYIYVDGRQGTTTGSISGINASESTTRIGMSADARVWYGNISDVRIYSRALSSGEIVDIHRNPNGIFQRDPIELWSASTQGGVTPSTLTPYYYQKLLAG